MRATSIFDLGTCRALSHRSIGGGGLRATTPNLLLMPGGLQQLLWALGTGAGILGNLKGSDLCLLKNRYLKDRYLVKLLATNNMRLRTTQLPHLSVWLIYA